MSEQAMEEQAGAEEKPGDNDMESQWDTQLKEKQRFFKEVTETREEMTKVIGEMKGGKLSGISGRNLPE